MTTPEAARRKARTTISRLWMLVRIVARMLQGSRGAPPTSAAVRAYMAAIHQQDADRAAR